MSNTVAIFAMFFITAIFMTYMVTILAKIKDVFVIEIIFEKGRLKIIIKKRG